MNNVQDEPTDDEIRRSLQAASCTTVEDFELASPGGNRWLGSKWVMHNGEHHSQFNDNKLFSDTTGWRSHHRKWQSTVFCSQYWRRHK